MGHPGITLIGVYTPDPVYTLDPGYGHIPYELRSTTHCTLPEWVIPRMGIPRIWGTHPEQLLSSTCWESIRLRLEHSMHSSGTPQIGVPGLGYLGSREYGLGCIIPMHVHDAHASG